jgi:hypothetical protein
VRNDKATKPDPAFGIDDALEDLIDTGALRDVFEDNPFLTARCYLGRAIALARKDELRQQAAREVLRDPLRKLEEKAQGLVERLREFAEDEFAEEARIPLATPITKGAEGLDAEAELRRRELPDDAIAAVQRLADGLTVHRGKITQQTDDAFRPAFIEEMVYCWVRLFGKAPGKIDEDFVSFVNAAHFTLTEATSIDLGLPFYVEPWHPAAERARNGDGWGWQITKTLKRMRCRPEWDRADRYEKGFETQSVGIQPSRVVFRRPAARIALAEFEKETKQLIALMSAAGPDGRAAAQILWCEYEIGGKEHRELLLKMGLNPADATALIGVGLRHRYGFVG